LIKEKKEDLARWVQYWLMKFGILPAPTETNAMKIIRYNNPSDIYSDWDAFFADPVRAFAPLFRSATSSAHEWYEDEENYYARIELPGVKREDLSLDAEDGLVRFSYEIRNERATNSESSTRSEKFEQVLRSPEGINLADISASLSDGILELTLPKADEKKPVRVEIK
jgi:HSP20 family protein